MDSMLFSRNILHSVATEIQVKVIKPQHNVAMTNSLTGIFSDRKTMLSLQFSNSLLDKK